MFNHGHPIEVLALVFAFAGLVCSIYEIVDAWKDHVAVIRSGQNGDKKVQAVGNLRREAFRGMMLVALVSAAAGAVLLEPIEPGPLPPDGVIIRATCAFIALLVVIDTFLDRRERQSFRNARKYGRRATDVRDRRADDDPAGFPRDAA